MTASPSVPTLVSVCLASSRRYRQASTAAIRRRGSSSATPNKRAIRSTFSQAAKVSIR